MTMEWQRLVSTKRLGREGDGTAAGTRTEYMRDWDRLVYSSAFRRLQDKTQVFPLSESDYVRTRLTHSIEVSSVGRSLGMQCGHFIVENNKGITLDAQDFGSIVAAACLAHDIGNPPFGHSGECAIQSWFSDGNRQYLEGLSKRQQNDFLKFEGNAQGFRLITRLQNEINRGGFQLTYAVLASFGKYPQASDMPISKKISEKKFGYCDDDADNFTLVANGVGLIKKNSGAYCRHPLAFLMEAADDICYNVVDLEDGHRVGRVSFEQAKNLLWEIAFPDGKTSSPSYERIDDDDGRIEYLRARAIGNLIEATVDVFKQQYVHIMNGELENDLVSLCKYAANLKAIFKLSRERIYTTPTVLQIEAAGFEILGGLLDKFVPALLNAPDTRSKAHQKIVEIIPGQFTKGKSRYEQLLSATDYISGMTDTYALKLFRRLHGIELPGLTQ